MVRPTSLLRRCAIQPGLYDLDLVIGGVGRAVLPCCLGASDPDLMRAGPVIPKVAETLWLVAHADERHRPEVRAMIDRLRAFFRERECLLSGALGC